RRAAQPRRDVDTADRAGSLPGPAHAAGRDRRRERLGGAALARRDVHGAADQHPEPEQPDAARAPQLSAGAGSRGTSRRAGGARTRRLPPDADARLPAPPTPVLRLAPDPAGTT